QEEVLPRLEATPLQDGAEQLVGGPRVGGALQDDQLAGTQVGPDGLPGTHDVGQVGLTRVRQGGGDADDDGIDLLQTGGVGGRGEAARTDQLADTAGGDVLDVTLAGLELLDFLRINVEAHHLVTGLNKGVGQGKAHVAEPDHRNPCRPQFDAG